jgi:hypothetical protein
MPCKEAVLQLERVGNDMAEISQNINVFALWWHDIETHLLNLKLKIEQFGVSKLNADMVGLIQQRWENIANQHRAYISEVCLTIC